MDIKLYNLPGPTSEGLEETYCHVLTLYRSGDITDPEIIDWLDAANTWLETSDDRRSN
jgi:hypothetical protein